MHFPLTHPSSMAEQSKLRKADESKLRNVYNDEGFEFDD